MRPPQISRYFRLALVAGLVLCANFTTQAAISVTEAPAQSSDVDYSKFSEDADARTVESNTKTRLEAKKRAKRNSTVLNILIVAGPVLLLIICALLFVWSKSNKRGQTHARSVMKEFKRAEAKRRSRGGPTQELDPRQW